MKALFALALPVALLLAPAAPLAGTAEKPTVLTVKRPAGPEWFGLYLLGKKAGWSRIEVVRERRAGADVLVARQETFLQATLADRQVQRRERDEKVYEARPGGRLLIFVSERDGDGGNRRMEMGCSHKTCRATFSSEGGVQMRDLPPTAEKTEQADPARLAAALRGTVTGAQLEPEKLREKKMKDVFERRARLAGAGVELAVSVVAESSDEDRVPARVSIADDGRIVELRLGESLVARAEPEEIAKRLDKVDLFNLSRVPLAAALPRSVPGSIVYRIRGLPPEFQKADGRQSYAAGPAGETLLTVSARPPTTSEKDAHRPVPPTAQLKEFLQATPEIDADDPAISKLAREVVGSSQGVLAASTKLVHFVYKRLEKVYGQSRDRASEVLRFGKGDCTEHALLFVAMARAAGIPARGVHGLVYAEYEDRVPALYWHAWAEVKAGDDWIAVDPTFDQPVADATHIVLGKGTQVDSVGLLGALAVVEAKPKALP
jgi:transglutaminase-like putative cysteine protease